MVISVLAGLLAFPGPPRLPEPCSPRPPADRRRAALSGDHETDPQRGSQLQVQPRSSTGVPLHRSGVVRRPITKTDGKDNIFFAWLSKKQPGPDGPG